MAKFAGSSEKAKKKKDSSAAPNGSIKTWVGGGGFSQKDTLNSPLPFVP